MKYLIMLLLLTGCSKYVRPKDSRGSLTWQFPHTIKASCPANRDVIYEDISVHTNWDTHYQDVEYSWQCTLKTNSDDTYRVKVFLNKRST